MSAKDKEFVADVVTNYPGSTIARCFNGAGEIEMEFDPTDSKLPIMLNCNAYWFSPKQARKIAKILNQTADAVEAKLA